MRVPVILQQEDIERAVQQLSQLDPRSVDDIRRGMEQLEAAICQMRPRRWEPPYDGQEAPILRPHLPRDRARMDEVFRNVLVFFWQMYFPHYRVLLQRMAAGLESLSLEQHLSFVQGNWFAAVLAMKFVEAHYSRFPHWHAIWLRTQLEYLEKTTVQVAQEYGIPVWQVRLAAWVHGLAPERGWRGLLWALGLRKAALPASQPRVAVAEQVSFADDIYVRPRQGRIFVPVSTIL